MQTGPAAFPPFLGGHKQGRHVQQHDTPELTGTSQVEHQIAELLDAGPDLVVTCFCFVANSSMVFRICLSSMVGMIGYPSINMSLVLNLVMWKNVLQSAIVFLFPMIALFSIWWYGDRMICWLTWIHAMTLGTAAGYFSVWRKALHDAANNPEYHHTHSISADIHVY